MKVIEVRPTTIERVEDQPTSAVPPLRRQTIEPQAASADYRHWWPMTLGAAIVEAITSSQIEGIHATVTQAYLAFMQPQHPAVTDAGRAVAANIYAVLDAFNGSVTYATHHIAHAKLMRGQRTDEYAGGYRTTNVRVGTHVGPAPRRVQELMEDLAAFVHDRPATIVNAAVAHAQFETIHPYPDGNGRIGRALLAGHLGLPISAYIAERRFVYYDALRDFRLGDAGPIFRLVAHAAAAGIDLLREATQQLDGWDDGLSRDARRLAARARHILLGTREHMMGGVNASTAAALVELEDAGVVREVTGDLGRNTLLAFIPVFAGWAHLADPDVYGTKSETTWIRRLAC